MHQKQSNAVKGWNIPVYNAIRAYIRDTPLPFHMPGHKLGTCFPKEFLTEIERMDLTELPGLDNLHMPDGVIREAQELVAAAFGAKHSFFLVNGSTAGLHVAIATVCRPGQQLVTVRNCHRAVINGMFLAGAEPVYIMPDYIGESSISSGVDAESIKQALDMSPNAAGVLITRPDYYGVCCDIGAIAKIVHERGKLLIVDEAHGAHLVFNHRLPAGSLEKGADISIQSAHKTLPAFTQGAYLHVASDKVDLQRLEYFLDIFQTTSPSYIIMAFLDIAREFMQKYGKDKLDRLLDTIDENKVNMPAAGVRLLDKSLLPDFDHDATRIVANVEELGITGYEAEKLLKNLFNIQVEMSDMGNVVCISTVADDEGSIRRLFAGLASLGKHAGSDGFHKKNLLSVKSLQPVCRAPRTDKTPGGKNFSYGQQRLPATYRHLVGLPEQAVKLSEIAEFSFESIPLGSAAGRISRDIISPYPPGVALVCPGEVFNAKLVEYLQEIVARGGKIVGVGGADGGDGRNCTVNVLKSTRPAPQR